ncbi:MAG: transporter [Actinoplanes sp.]
MASTDDDLPLGDPAESLALIERERANIERDLTPDPRLMLWPWGIAWVVSFTVFFLRFGPDGRVFVDLPGWLPLLLLAVLTIAAGITTGIVGARAGRQVTGPTSRQGMFYGITWSVAFTVFSVLFSQFSPLLPEDMVGLLWAGGMVGVTGVMYMAGSALWNDRTMFVLGAWICLIDVVGILAGPGWHSLIIAVAGGGGMLAAGTIGWLRLR